MKNKTPDPKPLHFLRQNPAHRPESGVEVVASKKEFKNAIRRNKARRRIKEAYRTISKQNKPALKINAKIGSLSTSFNDLKDIIGKEIDNEKR